MGKSGRGRREKKVAGPAMTDDELLEQAVAENKAAREKEIADGCPTKAELIAALDSITLFDLRVVEDGGAKQTCLSPAGDYVFYVDVDDASRALEARKLTHPGHLALGVTTLGRAFGLTEVQAFGFSTNVKFPMHIQGSTAVIDDLVNDGLDAGAKSLVPKDLRSQLNSKTSSIPMFSLAELVEGTETAPHFFTKADMVTYWMAKTGKKQEELPRHLIMTDLRVLIVRMMTVPADWKAIKLVPLTSTVAVLQGVTNAQQTAAEQTGAAAEAALADAPPRPEDDDEPPPLL